MDTTPAHHITSGDVGMTGIGVVPKDHKVLSIVLGTRILLLIPACERGSRVTIKNNLNTSLSVYLIDFYSRTLLGIIGTMTKGRILLPVSYWGKDNEPLILVIETQDDNRFSIVMNLDEAEEREWTVLVSPSSSASATAVSFYPGE